MNINELKAYQAEKDHLMRHEGTHPANRLPERRFKSETEMQAEDMLDDAKKQGLNMEIEK